jgi:hypothetical protein
MKPKLSYLVILIPFIFISCNKNDPKPDDSGLFIKFFGTAKNTIGYSLQETSDGFILAGSSSLDGKPDMDILVVKTDKNGNRLWEQRIRTPRNEEAFCVKERNGVIYVLGYQDQPFADSTDILLVTMNSSGGNKQEYLFGDSATSEKGYSLNFLEGDSLLIAGTNTSGTDQDMQVLKVSGSTVVWRQIVGVIGETDSLTKVISISQNRFLWCGSVERSGEFNMRLGLSDRNGLLQWQYEYDMFDDINQFGLDVTTAGNDFILLGYKEDSGKKLLVYKIDENGAKVSGFQSEPMESGTAGYSIANTSDGGFIVGGIKEVSDKSTDYLLLKLNSSGGSEWYQTFGGTRGDLLKQVIQTSDGGYAMIGMVDLFDDRNGVLAFIKTDDTGNVNKKKE